jgi:hypothetical protein
VHFTEKTCVIQYLLKTITLFFFDRSYKTKLTLKLVEILIFTLNYIFNIVFKEGDKPEKWKEGLCALLATIDL